MIEQKFSLEATKNGIQRTIYARQGENNARTLSIAITSSGKVISLNGYSAKFYYDSLDETETHIKYIDIPSPVSNPVEIVVPTYLCGFVGEHTCGIQFIKGTEIVFSPELTIVIESQVGSSGGSQVNPDATIEWQPLIAGLPDYEGTLDGDEKIPMYDPDVGDTKLVPYYNDHSTVMDVADRMDNAENDIDALEENKQDKITSDNKLSADLVSGLPTSLSQFTDDLGSSPTHTHSQYLTEHQDISGKVDKVDGKGLSTNDYTDVDKGIVEGVTSALAGKVDAVSGKGLSTEDFTTAEKTKLAGISENAKNVSVSASGTATDEVQFITVDGIEKKIAGGGAVNDVYVDGISVLDSEKIAQINLTGKEQKIYTGKMQITSQSPMTLAWISEAGNSYADMRNAYENGSKVEIALMTGVNQWTKLACTTYDSSFFSFQLPLRFTGSAPIIHYFVVIDSNGISVINKQIAFADDIPVAAGDISYDSTVAYSSGTVGKALSDLNSEINGINDLVGSGVIE